MARISFKHRTFLLPALAALLVSALGGSAVAQGPGYGTPSWAPDWFKYCTNPKQWVQWTLDNSGVLQMTDWGNNYGSTLNTPILAFPGGDSVSVWMDNDARSDHYKQVWFQMNWDYAGAVPSFGPATLHWWYGTTGGAVSLSQPNSGPVGPGLGQGYFVDWNNQTVTFYWEVFPQPDWERLSLYASGVLVTNIQMLTQCNPIPEPAFFQMGALLGLGGLGALRLRRR
jgi:hypothetical protein